MTNEDLVKEMIEKELARRGINAKVVEVGSEKRGRGRPRKESQIPDECQGRKVGIGPNPKVEDLLGWFGELVEHQDEGEVKERLKAVHCLAVDGANAGLALAIIGDVLDQYKSRND